MGLPKELNYDLPLPLIPSGTASYEQQIGPTGGSAPISLINAGAQVSFDLPNRGNMDGKTLYIKYKGTPSAGTISHIKGCPAYTTILKVETHIGSTLMETLPDFNKVMNFKVNTTMNIGQKFGNPNLGYQTFNGVVSPASLDGRFCPAGDVMSLSAPLECAFFNVENGVLIPMHAMAGVRITLTFDSIANIFIPPTIAIAAGVAGAIETPATVLPTTFDISEIFLCYTMICFPQEIDDTIRRLYAKNPLTLKTTSYTIGALGIPVASSGNTDLYFNHRLTSIRAVFLLMSAALSTNSMLDSFDITTGGTVAAPAGGGEYSILVGGKQYPQRPHSTVGSAKLAMFMELRKCIGSIFDRANNVSITTAEWTKNLLVLAAQADRAAASSAIDPAKFYPAFRTQLLQSNNVYLSGVSSSESGVSVKINIGTPTLAAVSVSCLSVHDMIIEIDVNSKTARSIV